MEKIGELCEIRGELIIEWKIKTRSLLSDEKNVRYDSSNFYFSGASWCFWFYPNGDREEADDYIRIYLKRKSSGSSVMIEAIVCVKTPDGKVWFNKNCKSSFEELSRESNPKNIYWSTLKDWKTELITSDELIISCSLKSNGPNVISESLFHRFEQVSQNLKYIYKTGKRTDCTLKVERENIPAHRVILESRSPVFAAMFNHDTKENQTGEVCIEDLDKSTIDAILSYLYSGDIDKLGTENVLSFYAAAEKYDIKEVKDMCVKFILNNLSGKWLYDIIKFTTMFKEDEVRHRAREYFIKKSGDILNSDEWKSFVKECPEIVLSFLS